MKKINLMPALLIACNLSLSAAEANEQEDKDQQNVTHTEPVEPSEESGSAAEMAKKLANPLAAMISLPMQLNYDQDFGAEDKGDRYLLNVQPVVPFSISDNWNLISRTIMPLVSQDEVVTGTGTQSGLGDITESLWFSPVKPTSNGWILGVGPVLLLPTVTDDLLGGEKWGLGPK